jgi:hypothetical protein
MGVEVGVGRGDFRLQRLLLEPAQCGVGDLVPPVINGE